MDNRIADTKLITEEKVQEMLDISEKKCRRLFHTKDFPGFFIGKKGYVLEDKLYEYLSSISGQKVKINYGNKSGQR